MNLSFLLGGAISSSFGSLDIKPVWGMRMVLFLIEAAIGLYNARTGSGVALENFGLAEPCELPTESDNPPLPKVKPKSCSPNMELWPILLSSKLLSSTLLSRFPVLRYFCFWSKFIGTVKSWVL